MPSPEHREVTAEEYQAMVSKDNKYGARKVTLDGITFDSGKEATRYQELKLLLFAGEVADLELQPQFPLIVNGQKVGVYKADFRWVDAAGETVVEDVKAKATRTEAYQLRKRLVKALYGITIKET